MYINTISNTSLMSAVAGAGVKPFLWTLRASQDARESPGFAQENPVAPHALIKGSRESLGWGLASR